MLVSGLARAARTGGGRVCLHGYRAHAVRLHHARTCVCAWQRDPARTRTAYVNPQTNTCTIGPVRADIRSSGFLQRVDHARRRPLRCPSEFDVRDGRRGKGLGCRCERGAVVGREGGRHTGGDVKRPGHVVPQRHGELELHGSGVPRSIQRHRLGLVNAAATRACSSQRCDVGDHRFTQPSSMVTRMIQHASSRPSKGWSHLRGLIYRNTQTIRWSKPSLEPHPPMATYSPTLHPPSHVPMLHRAPRCATEHEAAKVRALPALHVWRGAGRHHHALSRSNPNGRSTAC